MKVLYYPYDEESYPYFDMIKSEDTYLVSPIGWGYSGKKVTLDGKMYEVFPEFEEKIKSVDVVWIVNSRWKLDFEMYIYPQVEQSVKLRKKLIITRNLEKDELDKIKNLAPKEQLIIPECKSVDEEDRKLFPIAATIVFVTGLDEYCNLDHTLIILQNELVRLGYQSIAVLSKKEGMVAGLPVYPDFMCDKGISEQDQIIAFNHYIKELENLKRPEIILIGIPGALKNISTNCIGNMGLNAFKTSQALLPDYVIVNLMFAQWEEHYFNHLSKDLFRFFQKDVDIFNVIDQVLDVEESENKQSTQYITVSAEFVEEQLKNNPNNSAVHLSNKKNIGAFVQSMVDKLESYNELGDDYVV